jgi:hypothetical protein
LNTKRRISLRGSFV